MILQFPKGKMVILLMYNIYLFRNKERTRVHAFEWSRENTGRWSLWAVLQFVRSHFSYFFRYRVQVPASTQLMMRARATRTGNVGLEKRNCS